MVDDLRRTLRHRRSALDATEQAARAQRLPALASSLPWWSAAHSVALYRAVGGELDVGPIGELAARAGMTTYVPIVDGDHLRFGRYDAATTWVANRFGILEPEGTTIVDAAALDLVFVPAVGVDRRGNRVGMGAGFYDRTFAELGSGPRPGATVLVAAVHDEQVVDAIEPHPWDVAMDAVITPTGVTITAAM